jgi:hypothetical protein
MENSLEGINRMTTDTPRTDAKAEIKNYCDHKFVSVQECTLCGKTFDVLPSENECWENFEAVCNKIKTEAEAEMQDAEELVDTLNRLENRVAALSAICLLFRDGTTGGHFENVNLALRQLKALDTSEDMQRKSKTPRTNAYDRHWPSETECVPSTIARELERELTASKAEVERLNGLLSDLLILTEKIYWNSNNYKIIKEAHHDYK